MRILPSDKLAKEVAIRQHILCWLLNPQCHWDSNIPDVERRVAISDLLVQIQELLKEKEEMEIFEKWKLSKQ